MLNRIGRRGFIGNAAAAMVFLKGTIAIASDGDATVHQALLLVRSLVTIAHSIKGNSGRWPTKPELLSELLKAKTSMGDKAPSWNALLDFNSDEILRGWKLDYSSDEGGYVLILVGKSGDILITDTEALIYHSLNAGTVLPAAKNLRRAKDFPGAKPFNESKLAPSVSWFWRTL